MTEKEKNDFIYSEYQRMSDIFKSLPEDKFSVVYPLIKSACFMRATLEDLAEIINEQGTVEIYRNSETQYGTKMSAALQSYTNTGRLYANVIKQLYGYLPERHVLTKHEPDPIIPHEKTEEEKAEDRRREEEHQRELDVESALGSEFQRREREEGLRDSFGNFCAQMRASGEVDKIYDAFIAKRAEEAKKTTWRI